MDKVRYVFAVTVYFYGGKEDVAEPIITVFDNREAAEKYYSTTRCRCKDGCYKVCIDRAPLYREFITTGVATKGT